MKRAITQRTFITALSVALTCGMGGDTPGRGALAYLRKPIGDRLLLATISAVNAYARAVEKEADFLTPDSARRSWN